MAETPPKRVAVAVSKYQIGHIEWPSSDPVVLTGGDSEENAVIVYKQMGSKGDNWFPLSRERLEADMNTFLPELDRARRWKAEDVHQFIVFLSLEALHGHEATSRISPVENALLWQLPMSKLIYVTSTPLETARSWQKSVNHEYAHLVRVHDMHDRLGGAAMMRLIEVFIRDGEVTMKRRR